MCSGRCFIGAEGVNLCDVFFVVCWCSLCIVLYHCHRVKAHSQLIIYIYNHRDNFTFFLAFAVEDLWVGYDFCGN
jgi:hypothetical protein